jgi:hypothetical protein
MRHWHASCKRERAETLSIIDLGEGEKDKRESALFNIDKIPYYYFKIDSL